MCASAIDTAFVSVSAVRAAHRERQKQYRAEGDHPAVLDNIKTFIDRAKATGAVLDSEEDQAAVQSLVDMWASILYKAGWEVPDPTLQPFDPHLAPSLPESAIPYIGLEPFSENNQELFFGRQAFVQKIIERLRSETFIALIGPSGSGKSSVMLAGVLPALRTGALSAKQSGDPVQLRILPRMVPGSDPLRNLAKTLRQGGETEEWIQQQVSALRQNANHLRDLAALYADGPTVLVIDQFEEVSTLCGDRDARKAFEENLIGFIRKVPDEHRNILLLTMRNDFIGAVAQQQDFKALLEQALEPMTPMSAAELRDAIEKPAQRIGLKFEPGVVDALVHDILGEPAALPLLQFTLLKLWEKREHSYVTMAAYRALGGGREALTRTADEFINNLIPQERTLVERVFLRLVRPAVHGENVANRYRKDALYDLGARDRIDIALEKLVAARLIRITGDLAGSDAEVEVAHEALVRNWDYLVRLLDKERERLTTRQRLEAKAEEWLRLGRGRAGLLTEAALAQAEEWLNSPDSDVVGASLNLRDLVRKSKQTAERAQRLRFVVIVALAVLAVAAGCFAVAAGVFALKVREQNRQITVADCDLREQKGTLQTQTQTLQTQTQTLQTQAATLASAVQKADEKATLYDAGRIASDAEAAIDANQAPQSTLLLSLKAAYVLVRKGIGLTPEIADPIHRAIAFSAERFEIPLGSAVDRVAFSPDGSSFVTAGKNQRVRMWNSATGELIRPVGPENANAIAFSPDGKSLALASNGRLQLINLADSTPLSDFGGASSEPIQKVAFSPDGQRLAAVLNEKCLLWRVNKPNQPLPLAGHSKQINVLAFNATGDFLATGSDDGTANIWDADGGHLLRTLKGPQSIRGIAFNPETQTIAAIGGDRSITEWRLFPIQFDPLVLAQSKASGQNQFDVLARIQQPPSAFVSNFSPVFGTHEAPVIGTAFTVDGKRLLTIGLDGSVTRSNLSNPRVVDRFVLEGYGDEHSPFAFSPDGTRLLFVDPHQSAHMVKIDTTEELLTLSAGSAVMNAWISGGGSKIITLGSQALKFFDLAQRGAEYVRILRLRKIPGDPLRKILPDLAPTSGEIDPDLLLSRSIMLDPSGRTMAFQAGASMRSQVWVRNLPACTPTLVPDSSEITRFALAASGDRLIGVSRTTLDIWDLKTNRRVLSVPQQCTQITGFAAASDGNRAAIVCGDGSVATWALNGPTPRKTQRADVGKISVLALSPDGSLLATAGAGTTYKLFSASNLEAHSEPLVGHRGGIRALSFSADGKLLATAGSDQTIIVWSLDSRTPGKRLETITGLPSVPIAVQFSGAEKDVVAVLTDGSIRVFASSPARLIQTASTRITHPVETEACDRDEICRSLNASTNFLAKANWLARSTKTLATAEADFQHAHSQLPAFPLGPNLLAEREQQFAQAESIRQTIQGRLVQAEYLARAQETQLAKGVVSDISLADYGIDLKKLSDDAKSKAATDLRDAAVFLLQGSDPLRINTEPTIYEDLLRRASFEDPQGAAEVLTAWAYTRKASLLFQQGKIQEGIDAIRLSRIYSNPPPSDTDAGIQNVLCWNGTTYGFYELPDVQAACDKAVKLSGTGVINYLDSRGLNEALNGHTEQAKEDFSKYANSKDVSPIRRKMREGWIDRLQKGEKPSAIFTSDLLNELKKQ